MQYTPLRCRVQGNNKHQKSNVIAEKQLKAQKNRRTIDSTVQEGIWRH